jgi:hypothetical protein
VRKTFLPAALGETATSVLCMVSRTTDSLLARRTYMEVERSGRTILGSLPCRARKFCSLTEGAYGEPDQVLSAFSLLPLHLLGVHASMKDRAVESVTQASQARTSFCHLPPLYQCWNRHGLQCPECRIIAREQFGRRVSYCMHCADFITRCPLHDCELDCDEECSTLESLMNQSSEGVAGSNALRFARMTYSLAFLAPQTLTRERVFHSLREKGYVTQEGHVRVEPLRRALRSIFSEGFEDVRLDALIRDVDVVAAYLKAANSDRRVIHPVLMVLMEWLAADIDALPKSRCRRTSDTAMQVSDAAQLAAKRAAWMALRHESREMTRTQVRHRAQALWTWLYRHDRVWLKSNEAPIRRVGQPRTPRAIPTAVLNRIRGNTKDFRFSADGLAPLPSSYQTRISYGMSVVAFNLAASRLNGAGVLAQLPAQREVFVSRRVEHAQAQLTLSGAAVNSSSITRRSRLRKDTINRHAHIIHKQ